MEISILPIQALSIRACDTRLPPSSATAIFIGCPISAAFFSAAAITRRASAKLTIVSPYLTSNFDAWELSQPDWPQQLYIRHINSHRRLRELYVACRTERGLCNSEVTE